MFHVFRNKPLPTEFNNVDVSLCFQAWILPPPSIVDKVECLKCHVHSQGKAMNSTNTALYVEPYIKGSFSYVVGLREVYAARQGEMPIRIQKMWMPYECQLENVFYCLRFLLFSESQLLPLICLPVFHYLPILMTSWFLPSSSSLLCWRCALNNLFHFCYCLLFFLFSVRYFLLCFL
jgi:hypothetical protein